MLLLVLAGLTAVALGVLGVLHPRVLLVVLVTLDATNLTDVVQEHVGTSPFRPMLALAALAVLVLLRRGQLRLAWAPPLTGVLVLYAAWCASWATSRYPGDSTAVMGQHLRDLLYVVLVWVLLVSCGSWRTVLRVVVGALAALGALTVVHQYVLHNAGDLGGLSTVPLVQERGSLTPRHAGTSGDVNFWGRLLVLFVPFTLSLVALARRRSARLLWAAAALGLAGGTYLTQSRGSFLALGVAVAAWFAVAGRRYLRVLAYAPLVLLVVVPVSGIGSRLATLATLSSSTAPQVADPSLVTRARFARDALAMFVARPVTGFGVGTYPDAYKAFDRLSDHADPITIVPAAHNFYLEQASDGGLVLLVGWAVLFGTLVFAASRALVVARRTGDRDSELLGVAVVAGVAGWLAASAFLHLSDFRVLLLLAAVTGVVDLRAREVLARAGDGVPVPPPARVVLARSRVRRRYAVVLAAGLALVGTAGGAAVLQAPVGYASSVALPVLLAPGTPNGTRAYLLHLLSRTSTLPTLATAVQGRVDTALAGDEASGVQPTLDVSSIGSAVVVGAQGADRSAVEATARRAVGAAVTAATALGTPYRLADSGAPLVTVLEPGVRSAARPLLAVGAVGWLALAGSLVALWRTRRGPARI